MSTRTNTSPQHPPSADSQKDEKGRFLPGNSGFGGRPKGSRNKLGEAFVQALHEDFEAGGVEAIQRVRSEDPAAYMRVIASLLPKELKIEAVSDLSDEQLDERIRQLAGALGLEVGTGQSSGGTATAKGSASVN